MPISSNDKKENLLSDNTLILNASPRKPKIVNKETQANFVLPYLKKSSLSLNSTKTSFHTNLNSNPIEKFFELDETINKSNKFDTKISIRQRDAAVTKEKLYKNSDIESFLDDKLRTFADKENTSAKLSLHGNKRFKIDFDQVKQNGINLKLQKNYNLREVTLKAEKSPSHGLSQVPLDATIFTEINSKSETSLSLSLSRNSTRKRAYENNTSNQEELKQIKLTDVKSIPDLPGANFHLAKGDINGKEHSNASIYRDEQNLFNLNNSLFNKPKLLTANQKLDIHTKTKLIVGKSEKNPFTIKFNFPQVKRIKKPELHKTTVTRDNFDKRGIKRKLYNQNIVAIDKETKKYKTNMSISERRAIDERPINGYISRSSHNDDSSTAISNHYYQCPQPNMATLCNIGNTCYLNSVVYTLRFAPLFLHNLHHLVDDLSHIQQTINKYKAKSSSLGRNVSGIHMENARSWSSKDLASLENSSCDIPKSNQQIATEKLHELYQNLHRNEINEATDPFHADTFLHAIQEVSAIFEGNQQQDAHEFLMCVLDSIRETCQSLIKAVSEYPDIITNGFTSLPEQSELPTTKEQTSQRENSSSAIIKTSFFSRKPKRKEEPKNSKNIRMQSPQKDNTQLSPDLSDGANSDKLNAKSSYKTENDVTLKDKERISEKIKKLGLDFFTEDFEGITVSTTKCLSCETVTEQKETMIDIAVPISGYESTDTADRSQSFIQNSCITREYFRGENKYRCEQCIGYTEAIRSISYEVLPRLLVIQLSRFSGGMEKINSYLPTPFTLQCFCAKCCKEESKKLHVYKLYSVITHVGATMSVGHYIAYTCSLDWANDYVNCPKDRRRQNYLNSRGSVVSAPGNSVNNGNSEKNVGIVKKMIFGRSKASSSGDMSKSVKNINGISTKTLTNGTDKLSINTTCQSVNCCGIRLKNNYCSNSNYNNGSCSNNSNGLLLELDDNQTAHSYNTNNFNNTVNYSGSSRSKMTNTNEPVWYMCDDDKIKVMSQREFEELLSPKRKIMITPYLLFYARSDLQ